MLNAIDLKIYKSCMKSKFSIRISRCFGLHKLLNSNYMLSQTCSLLFSYTCRTCSTCAIYSTFNCKTFVMHPQSHLVTHAPSAPEPLISIYLETFARSVCALQSHEVAACHYIIAFSFTFAFEKP